MFLTSAQLPRAPSDDSPETPAADAIEPTPRGSELTEHIDRTPVLPQARLMSPM